MAKSFASSAAFKISLEVRIKSVASQRHVPINSLRLKLVLERLLARLFAKGNPPWVLKGGYAMELRYRARHAILILRVMPQKALNYRHGFVSCASNCRLPRTSIWGDYLTFRIEEPQEELVGAPMGGARFPCEAFLAGKTYGRFHIDLGFGDDTGETPEVLAGDNLLEFAGIPPARVLAIPKPQQFAEKIHAYTKPWSDRVNVQTKDLVDLVLLIETAGVQPQEVAAAIQTTFARRHAHTIPPELLDPPEAWKNEFVALAAEARLVAATLPAAIHVLRQFWQQVVK